MNIRKDYRTILKIFAESHPAPVSAKEIRDKTGWTKQKEGAILSQLQGYFTAERISGKLYRLKTDEVWDGLICDKRVYEALKSAPLPLSISELVEMTECSPEKVREALRNNADKIERYVTSKTYYQLTDTGLEVVKKLGLI